MGAGRGQSLFQAARGSSWLTPARVERWSWFFLGGYVLFFLGLIGTAHGLNDLAGRPLGADFSSFYSAGALAQQGKSPYDQSLLHGIEQRLFGPATPYFGFAYPPIFLLLLAPLSRLSYPVALIVWQAGTLAIYALAMERLRRTFAPRLPPPLFLLASLAYSAVFVNLACGQNGLLTAALFAFALAWLDARPMLAGFCIGLLAFKPQLGVLIPFALAASGRWRTIMAAGMSVLAVAGLSIAQFGTSAWLGFFSAGNYSRQAILDKGLVGYEKMVSIFAALRLWDVPLAAAYAGQAIAALAGLAVVILIWRARVDLRVKGAVLCLATFLVTPFALDYDMVLLAPAIALMTSRSRDEGAAPFEALLLALLWIVPLLSRTAGLVHIPLSILVISCAAINVAKRKAGNIARECSVP